MGGSIVAGEIKTTNLIGMLVFAYASSEHECNYNGDLWASSAFFRKITELTEIPHSPNIKGLFKFSAQKTYFIFT